MSFSKSTTDKNAIKRFFKNRFIVIDLDQSSPALAAKSWWEAHEENALIAAHFWVHPDGVTLKYISSSQATEASLLWRRTISYQTGEEVVSYILSEAVFEDKVGSEEHQERLIKELLEAGVTFPEPEVINEAFVNYALDLEEEYIL